MARSRYVKPEFFEDTTISELTIGARLLYIALWQLMDRGGICLSDPKLIRGYAFRYDEKIGIKQVREWLEELIQSKRIKRISYEGKEYFYCKALAEHQHFHRDEKAKYSIPYDILEAPCEHGASPVQATPDASASTPDILERISENGERRTENSASAEPRLHWLAKIWNEHSGPNLSKCREVSNARAKNIQARLRDNPNPDYWATVVKRIASSEFCCGSTGWRADFDWFLKPDSHIRVLEGKYDSNKPQSQGGINFDFLKKEKNNAS